MTSPRITVVGEGMLELREYGPRNGKAGSWALGHGGDTLNTAIHLARAGHQVAFATALGRDEFSQRLANGWTDEGLDLSLLLRHPERTSGMYAISVDDGGERSFSYWRDASAARAMFALPDTEVMIERAAQSDLLYFSLISLAILPPEGRKRLLNLAARVRKQGGRVAFDGNYRPKLWDSAKDAQETRDAALAHVDIGLPTLDDEIALSGDVEAEAVAAYWEDRGCGEVVVKLGPQGCRLPDGERSTPASILTPIDTSGAGDAFNAGYLHTRLSGGAPLHAAASGHRFAAWTIMRPGAIPPRDTYAPYA